MLIQIFAPSLAAVFFAALSLPAQAQPTSDAFPALPLPPTVGVLSLPETYRGGRKEHLDLITRTAAAAGLPAAVADAVAHVESRYDPGAVGGVGEIGLMQVRPQTAAMLGHTGGLTDLFIPEVNVRYGVMYLARAWQLADGDLCRALMKYRAGWGEQTMSPLSTEYCRRARQHLAAIGSPLAGSESAPAVASATPAPAPPRTTDKLGALSLSRQDLPLPPRRLPVPTVAGAPLPVPSPLKVKMAAVSPPKAASRGADIRKTALRRQMWVSHEARMGQITRRLGASALRIASGI